MSKITIEEINGKKYTVVWRDPEIYPCDADDTGWIDGVSNGELFGQDAYADDYIAIATALPALPRHPKPEDAALLYRYMAEGIEPWIDDRDGRYGAFYGLNPSNKDYAGAQWAAQRDSLSFCLRDNLVEITHATHNGERVEIAITDEAHNG